VEPYANTAAQRLHTQSGTFSCPAIHSAGSQCGDQTEERLALRLGSGAELLDFGFRRSAETFRRDVLPTMLTTKVDPVLPLVYSTGLALSERKAVKCGRGESRTAPP